MSNFLKNNQKTEIRARISNDIILYEPSEEQITKLKELMQEQQIKFDDNLNATGDVSYDTVRYIIKELCKDGEWVDEYTDEQLDNEFANGNRYIKRLQNEIILLLEEIVEDIQYDMYTQIKAINSVLNIVDKETEENKIYEKITKLLKKQGMNVSVQEFVDNKDNPEKLAEIIENSKVKNNKKNNRKKK